MNFITGREKLFLLPLKSPSSISHPPPLCFRIGFLICWYPQRLLQGLGAGRRWTWVRNWTTALVGSTADGILEFLEFCRFVSGFLWGQEKLLSSLDLPHYVQAGYFVPLLSLNKLYWGNDRSWKKRTGKRYRSIQWIPLKWQLAKVAEIKLQFGNHRRKAFRQHRILQCALLTWSDCTWRKKSAKITALK